MFSKHRRPEEKRGGALIIGFKEDKEVRLEEIEVENKDILALEGMVRGDKTRIILSYFDSSKNKSGDEYKNNRTMQGKIEELMNVEPGVALVVLGDINGRLTKLEPNIITDANGKMLENWATNLDMFHLNLTEQCLGKYTFQSKNGKSAIDHILVNERLFGNYLGMYIDEDRIQLDISDHCVVRAWFKINQRGSNTNWKKNEYKEISWIAREEDRMETFKNNFLPKVGKHKSFKKCIKKIKDSMELTMRRRKMIKLGKKGKETILAAKWVDQELIENINLRSSYNRQWRYARKRNAPEAEIKICEKRYREQQKKTAIMTELKKSTWEEKKIEETWKDGKKFWEMIRELVGKNRRKEEETYVYTEEGGKREIMKYIGEYMGEWKKNVYQKYKNTDFTFWYGDKDTIGWKEKLEEGLTNGDQGIMENPIITEKEFLDVIKEMKNGKATGIDEIPAELMKFIVKNKDICDYLLKCFNHAIKEAVHEDWLISRTTMIPKVKKPKIMEHRPIAVTVNSSKIICTVLREKIESFFKDKGIGYENQYGFTKGGRIEHCLFTIDYITNMTYERKHRKEKSLYLAFIDFKKAYDSIDRRRLIEVMIKFKINPQIIDIIVQMYEGDKTTISLGKMEETIEVTGGIRQGCSISTLLFKMVTFTIIEELNEKADPYKIRKYRNNSLWLADDATIIAKDEETMIKTLNILEEAGKKNGLELNDEKTKILRVKGPGTGKMIGRFKVEEEAKYLGVMVGGRGRNIYEAENKIWLEKAEKKANSILGQVNKSADRVIVGKAMWKMIAIPALLFGRAVVTTTKRNIGKLQIIENRVWRYLLGIGGYSTVEALRGEIGASMVKSRIMETMLQYLISTLSSQFSDIKEMMEDTILKGKGRWIKAIEEYRIELGLTWDQLREIDQPSLKRLVKEYDTEEWLKEMRSKPSLRFYIKEKSEVKYDMCYRNSLSSAYYARARTNSLKLEEQIGRGKIEYDRKCKMCEEEVEDIVHFTVKCEKLEGKRNYDLINKNLIDPEERMRTVLFRNEKRQEVGRMIRDMWVLRSELLREIGKKKKKETNNTKRAEKKNEDQVIIQKQEGKNKKNVDVKVVKDHEVRQMKNIKEEKEENKRQKIPVEMVRGHEVKIMKESREVKKLKAIKEESKGKNKKNVYVKVVKDQEVRQMKNIKVEKEENRRKKIIVEMVRDHEVKIMKESREVKKLKAIKEESKSRHQNIIEKQRNERGKTRN